MKKNKNNEPITFSMSKARRKFVGGFFASIGFFVLLLLIFTIVIEPIISGRASFTINWSSIELSDIILFLFDIFLFSLLTIFPITTGLYFFLKDIPQIRIEKDRLYYSSACTSNMSEKKAVIFFPYSHSVEDYSFDFASVQECTFNNKVIFSIHFVFYHSNSERTLTLTPVVSDKDKATIIQLISERVKKNNYSPSI